MNEKEILKISIRLGENVKKFKHRFIFDRLELRLFKEPRIKLVRGFRGSGKTTLLLQIFNKYGDKSIYLSMDNPIVAKESLYKILKSFILDGYEILLIDEIHKYPNWRSEVKAIYDEFPNVSIVCSGSAPIALIPERREEVIPVEPMSFREFLYLKYGLSVNSKSEWKNEKKSVELIGKLSPRIEAYFKEYVQVGGFPISLTYDLENAKKAIFYSIRKSIYEDSVNLLKMSQEKAFAMNKILVFLATSTPGELSINTIASSVGMSKSTVYEILDALEKMELIRIVKPYGRGAKLVRGSPKMLFYHPNFRYAICDSLGIEPNVGSVREELAVFDLESKEFKVYTIKGEKKVPDYYVEKIGVVEVEGKSKSRIQLKGFRKSLVLKPDQLIALSLF